MQSDWRTIAERKRVARDALIPDAWRFPPSHMPNADVLDVMHIPVQCGILSAAELEITDISAEGILERIRDELWTARAVCLAFCKRAAVAQQLVSLTCVVCR
jgi:amidase